MNELLFTVGIFMFMLTVYGSIVIGGHLLKVSQENEPSADRQPEPPTARRRSVSEQSHVL